jgi:hypothetical protein
MRRVPCRLSTPCYFCSWHIISGCGRSHEILRLLQDPKVRHKVLKNHRRSPSWARWMQFTPSSSISIRSILISSYHLHLGLLGGLFPPGFSTKISHSCINSPGSPQVPHNTWFDQPINIRWKVKIKQLLVMQLFPASCPLIPLRWKYSPNHTVLKRS